LAEKEKRIFKSLKKILEDTQRNGENGLGHPEALSGNLAGWSSKRIDDDNRLIFRIVGGVVEVAECKTHYGDN
jgi:toxin YoeB